MGVPRVLLVIKGLGRGGAEQLLLTGVGAGDRDRCHYEVAYVLARKAALADGFAALDVDVHALGKIRRGDPRWVLRLRRLVVGGRFDIVHSHSPLVAVVIRVMSLTIPRGRPSLMYTEHNLWAAYRLPTRVLNALTLWREQHLLAVSEAARDTMWAPWRTRTEVLVHGIDVGALRARLADGASAREELGVTADQVLALAVGNLRSHKDYGRLLRATRIAIDEGASLRVAIVGEGPEEGTLRRLRSALGLEDDVLLLGSRADVARLLDAADLFVSSSVEEGLPVALMEALAAGLPVLATAVGGIPEAVTSGREGVLVEAGDPVALGSALAALAADPDRRARLGAAAAGRGAQFDARRSQARLEELYRAIGVGTGEAASAA